MADSESVLIEDSFKKPNPLQETGEQRDYAVTFRQQQQGRVTEPTEGNALEDLSMREMFVQLMIKLIQKVWNFSLGNFFGILYAAAIGVPKILLEWEMAKEHVKERDQMEMKDKEKEVTLQLDNIRQQKKDLEEKVYFLRPKTSVPFKIQRTRKKDTYRIVVHNYTLTSHLQRNIPFRRKQRIQWNLNEIMNPLFSGFTDNAGRNLTIKSRKYPLK